MSRNQNISASLANKYVNGALVDLHGICYIKCAHNQIPLWSHVFLLKNS